MDATDPIQNLHPNTCKQGAAHTWIAASQTLLTMTG